MRKDTAKPWPASRMAGRTRAAVEALIVFKHNAIKMKVQIMLHQHQRQQYNQERERERASEIGERECS